MKIREFYGGGGQLPKCMSTEERDSPAKKQVVCVVVPHFNQPGNV